MSVLRRSMRWLTERRAATAVVFALTVTPILGFVALAFDVGSVVWARSQLDLAADAAALSAVITGANGFAADPASWVPDPAQKAGVQRFDAQAGRLPGVSVTVLDVGVTRNGGTISAMVSYQATYKTEFAGLLGFPTLPASGSATASRTNSPFFEIDILMDDSSSMAIAASQPDMARLGALVAKSPLFKAWGQNQNCAFGCHFDAKNNDFYGLAKHASPPVPLRIDVLTAAVQNVINTVAGSPAAPQFEIGLYSFNATFNTVHAADADLAAAAAAAGNMVVPVTTNGGSADTNIPLALKQITAVTPAAGDGSTQGAPKRFLFIVTDGVADYFDSGGKRVIAALDPTQCSALKAKGVQVLTLYTQYFPLVYPPTQAPTFPPTPSPSPNNAFYVANVYPFIGNLAPNLQACASSPSFAFQATDAPSIGVALQAMLQAALSAPARFTQ
ncbi:MAG: pilus assembly protein TadG-related protein [Acetobacteraceae bacterium]